LHLYCQLIQLRKRWPCLHNGRKDLTHVEINDAARWLRMERSDRSGSRAVLFCNFSNSAVLPNLENRDWTLAFSSAAGPGNPPAVPACSASLYVSA
jgi:hypothetical protein